MSDEFLTCGKDLKYYTYYPFVNEAVQYALSFGYASRLIKGKAFEAVRKRGTERVLQSLAGDITKPKIAEAEEGKLLTEYLSFFYAKAIVEVINDGFLLRKHAHAEAKAARRTLVNENPEIMTRIAQDFLGYIESNLEGCDSVLHEAIRFRIQDVEPICYFEEPSEDVDTITEALKEAKTDHHAKTNMALWQEIAVNHFKD